MGDLVARPDDGQREPDNRLSPEVAAWVRELRGLWQATGMSMNRFAAANPVDKGTLSRYLNGKRVPRQSWLLDRLLAIQAENGKEVAQEVREHLTRLQLEALKVAHPHEYRVRLVSDELEIAVIGQREAERYAHSLEQELAGRIRQVEELTHHHDKLRAASDIDRAEIARLRHEIADLTGQLQHARRRTAAAEEYCQRMEGILNQLETGPLNDSEKERWQRIRADRPLGRGTRDRPYFFLSYARSPFGDDPNKWIVKFYRDLCADISQLTGSTTPGYMDQQRLTIDAAWPYDLTQALSTCRVFLPIYSPQYFNSEHCGKEWTIFRWRMEQQAQGDSAPPVIVPAIWSPMDLEQLPELARLVRLDRADLPSPYLRQGLYGIMKLGRYREAYKETVFCLAKAIVVAAEVGLPPLDETERTWLNLIPNAFADLNRRGGSVDVRLTVAACDLNSLPPGRDRFYYGLKPLGWSPYRARDERPIADFAKEIIRGMGHHAQVKELGAGAEETPRPEVMLVDMWAADDARLAEEIRRSNGSAAVVVLPVDHEDRQSTEHRERLEAAMASLIGTSPLEAGSRCTVVHHDKFRESLTQAATTAINRHLTTVRMNVPPARPRPRLRRHEIS